jgi:hypothetical protein
VAAEFENTSFGAIRRREDAEKLAILRKVVSDRIVFVKDAEKLVRLELLIAAIDDVLHDLKT